VDPVPDPLLLRKSGSAGDRTRDLCICSQKLWPLDHRGGLKVNYWNKFEVNSASCWFLLYGYIAMHDQQNIQIAYHISIGTRCRSAVSLTTRPLCLLGKRPGNVLHTKLGRLQSQSVRFGGEKDLFLRRESNDYSSVVRFVVQPLYRQYPEPSSKGVLAISCFHRCWR